VNKLIHCEANAIFYARNEFDTTHLDPSVVSSVLNSMGRNAALIRRLRIEFPWAYRNREVDEMTLGGRGRKILSIVRSKCINVQDLTFALWGEIWVVDGATDIWVNILGNEQYAPTSETYPYKRMLGDLLQQFEALPNLRKVVVELVRRRHCDLLLQAIENCGWMLKSVKPELADHWNRRI
jgi:hypothetical protein